MTITESEFQNALIATRAIYAESEPENESYVLPEGWNPVSLEGFPLSTLLLRGVNINYVTKDREHYYYESGSNIDPQPVLDPKAILDFDIAGTTFYPDENGFKAVIVEHDGKYYMSIGGLDPDLFYVDSYRDLLAGFEGYTSLATNSSSPGQLYSAVALYEAFILGCVDS